MDLWADILTDIFFSICKRLAHRDIIVVNSVCKSWQMSGSLYLSGNQISPKFPWLMLAEKDKWGHSSSDTVRNFYDMSNGKIYNLNLPETISRVCLSVGFGWLLTIDINSSINLFHPLIGRKIELPHYSTLLKNNVIGRDKKVRRILFWKAVASTDPWNYKTQNFNQDCVIIATYERGLPAIVKLGDKAWKDIQTRHRHYYDDVFYRSQYILYYM
ncbi:hypothetical protein ACFE04_006453 [Oxalis oulophora]